MQELIWILHEAIKVAKLDDELLAKKPLEYYRPVIVPATIHRFIQEDMGQNAKDALRTMEESVELGYFFNDDCDDLNVYNYAGRILVTVLSYYAQLSIN